MPSTGNVGIGTMNPTNQLEVVGKTKLGKVNIIDTLTVYKPVNMKDSVTVDKKLTVKQDVKIVGKTVMTGNVRAKSNLTVLGNTRTKGNEIVEGNTKILGVTKMKGSAFVEGTFKIKSLANTTSNFDQLLLIKPNGKVDTVGSEKLTPILYPPQPVLCILNPSGSTPAPNWTSLPGNSVNPRVFYTGTGCPERVGIGTANPLMQFHVTENGLFEEQLNVGIAPSSLITNAKLNVNQISPNLNGININMTNTTYAPVHGVGVKVSVADPSRRAIAVVDASGNDKFRVYGSGSVEIRSNSTNSLNIVSPSGVNASIAMRSGTSQSDLLFYDNNNALAGVLRFGIKNGEGFLSFDDRTSGTPVEKFRVGQNGVVYAHEIKVTLGPFSDYVFEKDYNLMGLKALNNYIEQKGHLPNMPSAEEVDKNGIGIGELQIKLLEKVEELTLYILQLEKRINELENK